jgi:NADPH-dependent 2,4-dienoyl-CoA reductase/sulfur reductase-like enzyme
MQPAACTSLAAAMSLAHRGFKVTVFEKAPVIGGRNAEVTLGDYRLRLWAKPALESALGQLRDVRLRCGGEPALHRCAAL